MSLAVLDSGSEIHGGSHNYLGIFTMKMFLTRYYTKKKIIIITDTH